MAFAIEVAAETNPLTENLLIHTLRSASSSDPLQIQTGTKQLEQWQKAEHFYVHLQSAYLDRRLPFEIRYLAIIQLKNGIDKYWRKTALNAVTKEDKTSIRSRLIDPVLQEPIDRLALQNALVVAKIARFEFPNDWPDCISFLITRLRESSQLGSELALSRALLLLLRITKELSTARLQRSRQHLQAATPELLQVVADCYVALLGPLVASYDAAVWAEAQSRLAGGLLAIKLLRRLLVNGYDNPNRDQLVGHVWNLSLSNLSHFMQMRDPLQRSYQPLIDKHMIQLSKLHLEMARDHPAAFALLPHTLDLVSAYWSMITTLSQNWASTSAVSSTDTAVISHDGDVVEHSASEKLALRGLLIMRACIKMVYNPAHTFKYKHPIDKEERAQAVALVRGQILTEGFIEEMMDVIVTRFFVFRQSDLKQWEEEPDEWEKREEGEGEDWEFSVRPCAEKLFLDLAINFKEILVQPLLSAFESVANLSNEDVLLKDSIYTAVGLASPVLFEHLDFDAFVRDVLVQEVQKTSLGYKIIRRRAAIILGQWISIRVGAQTKRTVYQIFQHLLQQHDMNDQVVRITAARQLKNVVDDWELESDQFMPFAESILNDLMQLIQEVELTETKLAILHTLSAIVERLDYRISAFAPRIIELLPPLWDESAEEHVMQQAILTILSRLVVAMKSGSSPFHEMLIPIVATAVIPGSETHVYLMEDAMELWANILTQTPTGAASHQLLELSQHLYAVFDLGSESLRKALEITESYVLLAPSYVLGDHMRQRLLSSMASLIGQLKPDANGLVFVVLESILRSATMLGGEEAAGQIITDMHTTGVLRVILSGLRGSWKAHCTTGPLAETSPVDGIVETDYFAVLARAILGSTSMFCQAVQASTSEVDTDLGVTMKWLLEEWFNHLENVGDPSRRKLMCLALTKLLETNQSWILLNLQSLMTLWTDVVRELYDSQEQSSDALVQQGPENGADGPRVPEDDRRAALSQSDPVHTTALVGWIKQYLQQAATEQPNFEAEWVANVDKEVVAAFSQLGIL